MIRISTRSTRPPSQPATSPMAWILGHLVNSRYGAGGLLGATEVYEHAALTGRGSSSDDPEALPGLPATLAELRASGDRLAAGLDAISTASLDASGPAGVPSMDGTVLGTLTFLALHECYHLGQLGMLRKAAGLPGRNGPRWSLSPSSRTCWCSLTARRSMRN